MPTLPPHPLLIQLVQKTQLCPKDRWDIWETNRAPLVCVFQVKVQGEHCVNQLLHKLLFTPHSQSVKNFTKANASKGLLSGSAELSARNPERQS